MPGRTTLSLVTCSMVASTYDRRSCCPHPMIGNPSVRRPAWLPAPPLRPAPELLECGSGSAASGPPTAPELGKRESKCGGARTALGHDRANCGRSAPLPRKIRGCLPGFDPGRVTRYLSIRVRPTGQVRSSPDRRAVPRRIRLPSAAMGGRRTRPDRVCRGDRGCSVGARTSGNWPGRTGLSRIFDSAVEWKTY